MIRAINLVALLLPALIAAFDWPMWFLIPSAIAASFLASVRVASANRQWFDRPAGLAGATAINALPFGLVALLIYGAVRGVIYLL